MTSDNENISKTIQTYHVIFLKVGAPTWHPDIVIT